jgi:uncharacterized protein (TIGR03790 family)
MRFPALPLLLAVLAISATAAPAAAQTGDNVLLVLNKDSADSARVAGHYARVRGVPQEQVLRLALGAASDDIERADFDGRIQAPIAGWLRLHSAQDRILYIVLAKGIPLRIRGTTGRGGTLASVDSELTLLYRRMAGEAPPLPGPLPNPYYLGDRAVGEARPFSHRDADIYLVTRLDGYTVDDVLGLIDRGAAPSREGRILLDQRAARDTASGNTWLQQAADWMNGHGYGDRVILETTAQPAMGVKNLLGYYSWGSNDPAITARSLGLGFVPGAVAGLFVSTDARTFREPPPGWTTGAWLDPDKYWANSPQSLSGDLIRQGVTGVAGHVAEPFLDATIRPNILFPAYLSGFNLAESFYLAMPYVSWQTVVVGDPLCAPFPRKALQPSDIDPGIDPATELPSLFSARRLELAARQGVGPEAARWLLLGEARGAKGDKAGERKALEEATALDPRLLASQLRLAAMYEESRDYDKAIDRYRKVLDQSPDDPVALNNLAYALATRKGQAAEALPYAARAYRLTRGTPTVADTLAWVQHLLGRDQEAAPIAAAAVSALPANAELQLHAAVILAAVGKLEEARQHLAEAVRLDPSLAGTNEARALREKLGGK